MADSRTTNRQSGLGPGCGGRAVAAVPIRAHRYFARNKVGARGFTLIELMIVIAVIGVLLAIAYPSYQDAIRKSRRGEAKANLVEAGHVMERFHTENNTYVGTDVTGFSTPHYDVDDDGATAQGTFTLVATPVGDQLQDRCGVLTLNHAGVRTHATGDDAQCQFGTVPP